MFVDKKILLLKIVFILLLLFGIVDTNKDKYTISFDIDIIQNNSKFKGEVFYKDATTAQYSIDQFKYFWYKNKNNKSQNVKVTVSNPAPITAIRLDPLFNKGFVKISNFTIASVYDTHKIDFNNVSTQQSSHNIRILQKERDFIILECLGTDPYIEIVNNMVSSQSKFKSIFYLIVLFFILYAFLELFLFLLKTFSRDKILLSMILFVYALYTILGLDAEIGYHLLIIFGSISILLALNNNVPNKINYLKAISIFLFLYLGMSYLSMFTSTDLANLDYLNQKAPLIIAAALIPMAFYNLKPFNFKYVKIYLTVLLILSAVFIIILNMELISINYRKIYDVILRRSQWTQKSYMFWYILLMFGSMSFYNLKNKIDFMVVILLLILSYYTIFNGYSVSARLAFVTGVSIYIFFSIFKVKKKHLHTILWIFTLYIIFSPILFSLVDLTTYHPKLYDRDAIYHTAGALIKEHWLFGYGFGSTLSIHIEDFVSVLELPKHYIGSFPGGHPHNLSLLFWLEFGVFGAIFLSYYIHKLLHAFVDITYSHTNLPALFGMIVAFDIITSFSWSIWYPQVLLTYSFFGIMLVLSMNINMQRNEGT